MNLVPDLDHAVTIAAAVLAKASLLDYRIPESHGAIVAVWAEVFAGQQIWLPEALDAVTEHYRGQPDVRLMPAHVLQAIAAMPLGARSSDDRINAWLASWAAHPFSTAIGDRTGIPTPQWDAQPDMTTEQEVAWAREQNLAWVRAHRHELADAIRNGKPPQPR